MLMARINVMLAQAAQWNAARSQKNAQSVPAIPAENEAPEGGEGAIPYRGLYLTVTRLVL